jgi:GNAT superfamily N-acetyltransferase
MMPMIGESEDVTSPIRLLPGDIMTHALPTVEELYRGMGRMVVRFYGRTPGALCVVEPFAILGCSGLDSVFLNCGVVFGDGAAAGDSAEQRLQEFVARIRELGVGGYVCLSEPVQRRLEPLAREFGLKPLPPIPLMARGAEDAHVVERAPASEAVDALARLELDPAAVAIERVTRSGGLEEFLAVSEAAFDLPMELYGRVVTPDLLADPALRVYLCRLEGAPISGVCVVLDDGLAGISGMATVPGLQGRGIGSVLLAHTIAAHRDEVRAFYLTASEAGQRLYSRHGFVTVDAATAWVVPPPGV